MSKDAERTSDKQRSSSGKFFVGLVHTSSPLVRDNISPFGILPIQLTSIQ